MNLIFVDAAVDSLVLEIILVDGILDFYVLVVRGQPTNLYLADKNIFHFEFSLFKILFKVFSSSK